ncbi:MAG: hypothetical protein QXQ39_07935 [Conexivisphaerales archaeon]
MEILKIDKLGKVRESVREGKLREDIARQIESRLPLLEEAISRIKAASKLNYPPYYIMPLLIIVKSEVEYTTGIYYARNVAAVVNGRLNLLIEFTAPLLLYASRETLQAVAAHEFTHYLELIRRFTTALVTSPSPSTIFEATYKDMQEAFPPAKIFGKYRSLVTLIEKKFPSGFVDEPLNKRTIKNWLDMKLPYAVVRPDDNAVSIPVQAIANANLDPVAVEKIKSLGDGLN